MMSLLDIAIGVTGWIYFAAWSISFYPQIWTNLRRKSVIGLDFNFIALNLTGFVCYSIYNVCLYYLPSFQHDFQHFNPNQTIPVLANDVGFALHATFATLITIIQCLIYERGDQSVSLIVLIATVAVWIIGTILTFLVIVHKLSTYYHGYFFATVKLAISVTKYTPQAYFNYKRKSTIGWSIGNIILDFTGGSFSIIQAGLLAVKEDDWRVLIGNPVKFGLGLLSMAFDIFFMVQHYWLYTEREVIQGSNSDDRLYADQQAYQEANPSFRPSPKKSPDQSSIVTLPT